MTVFSNRTSLFLFAALSSTLVACSSGSDASSPGDEEAGGIDAAAVSEIEALAERAVEAGIPGVTVAIRRGERTLTIARGVADLGTGAPMTDAHRVRAASVAKSVVASVVLQLVSEGRIRLADTIDDWLPGVVPASGDVTIEQLVRQQSGLFDYGADPRLMAPYMAGDFGYHWEPAQLVSLSNDHPPTAEPGTRYEYSNTNFTLLALLVEKITGKSLAEAVSERILEPVGMQSSKMESGSRMDAPFARGYFLGLAEDPVDVTDMSASAVFGSGNLVSTPLDMVRFYRALSHGQVVDRALLPAMTTIDPDIPPSHYAMGLFRFDDSPLYPCGVFVGHDGGIPGYDTTAYTSLDGTRQFAIAVTSFTADEKAGGAAAQQAFADLNRAIACR